MTSIRFVTPLILLVLAAACCWRAVAAESGFSAVALRFVGVISSSSPRCSAGLGSREAFGGLLMCVRSAPSRRWHGCSQKAWRARKHGGDSCLGFSVRRLYRRCSPCPSGGSGHCQEAAFLVGGEGFIADHGPDLTDLVLPIREAGRAGAALPM